MIYIIIKIENTINFEKDSKNFAKDIIEKMKKIIKYTGRIPSELNDFLFTYNGEIEEYYRLKYEEYHNSLYLWLNGLKKNEKISFYENLELIFGYKIMDKRPVFYGSFYDKGLMYIEKPGSIPVFLNFPVEKLIRKIYIENIEIDPVCSVRDKEEQDILLKRQYLRLSMTSRTQNYVPNFTGKNRNPSTLNYKVYETFLLKEIEEIDEILETTVIFPTIKNFPYMDHIIYDPKEKLIIFKQITISKVKDHLKNEYKFNNQYPNHQDVGEVIHFLFLPVYRYVSKTKRYVTKNPNLSMCQTLIHIITKKDSKIKIKKDEFFITIENENFDIKIVYASGKEFNENGKLDLSLKNIQYYCKEELVKNGIVF